MLKSWFTMTRAGRRARSLSMRPSRSRTPPAEAADFKASRTGRLIAMHHAGRPVWTGHDYAPLTRAGMLQNPIVYRAVRMISEAASAVPWLLYEDDAELADHPLLDLLARPNPVESGIEFLESLYGYLLISGNAYLEAVCDDQSPREIYALRPDRMRLVPDRKGWPSAYEYTANGRAIRFELGDPLTTDAATPVTPILHMRFFHPLDDHYGLAPLQAAQTSLDVHNAATAWNKALLDNAARPSGALVYEGRDGANLSEDQYHRLKSELEDNYQGAANAGRPMLLEGGLIWRAMSLSPKELDYHEARNGAAREIALAFGVPPMLLGLPGDNTYANYAEANRALWRQTVLPLINRAANALTHWLAPAWTRNGNPAAGGRLRLGYDADAIDALAQERESLWNRVSASDFLTDDEKRRALGYGIRRSPGTAPAAFHDEADSLSGGQD